MITFKKIINRLPIELIPAKICESSILLALSRLKTQRNNAIHYEISIIEHNKKCTDKCESGQCEHECIHDHCPKYYMIDMD